MITTIRGFVLKIEIGRAGLVTVTVLLADGTIGTFVIRDLDADPERFNERLSKLAILRDAMNRAEPVEIEYSEGEGGLDIERAIRISRDALDPVMNATQVTGLVLGVLLHSENGVNGNGEKHDTAQVEVLTTTLTTTNLVLDMQTPERLVATAQLDMIRDAQARGSLARFVVDSASDKLGGSRIIAVAIADDSAAFDGDSVNDVSGFVETLSLIRTPAGGSIGAMLAHVKFTTAPAFTAAGNTVGLSPFTPVTLDLLVPKNSPTYDLFEAGLRDNLRMRVSVVTTRDGNDRQPVEGAAFTRTEMLAANGNPELIGLAAGAELLAPLASASRPVWIVIERTSLDHGPDGFKCTPGVPSSDLTPLSLRDLRIPYPAVWRGMGCFNHGVYRFQLQLPTDCKISVDGQALCLYDSDQPGVKLAHACLGGDHTVTVEVQAWMCDYEFVMDVYRLR